MAFVLQPKPAHNVFAERRSSGSDAGPSPRAFASDSIRCAALPGGDLQPPRAPLKIVTPKPQVRPVGPPPEPVPVRHSATFVERQARPQPGTGPGSTGAASTSADGDGSSSAALVQQRRQQRGTFGSSGDGEEEEEPFSGNAVQYLLRKADKSLDEVEENPPEAAKVLYEVSKSPVGEAAARGVEMISKVGFMAGKEAVKTIVPAAGRVAVWAVQQGTRAALGAAQKGMQRGLPDGGGGRRSGGGSAGGGSTRDQPEK